ncbi:MAG: 3'-5' exonuclease [Lachnospiraceae bacterium]|nr:3'-5' exonuclease [Lachnospiraceae bacterium]
MLNTYVALDLETTGLAPKHDKIIEIGALKVVDGHETDTFSSFVNPGRKLEERIVELTGIRDTQLSDAPYIEEILDSLFDFLGDFPLLGHRILFDYSFLKKAAVDYKRSFEKSGVDTLRIARRYLPELEHKNLPYLCTYYQIPHQAHRAFQDAEATHKLYQKLAELFYKDEEAALFLPAPLHYAAKRDTPATKPQKERLYRLLSQHNITLDLDVEKLTRSEASRMTDKLLATYGR